MDKQRYRQVLTYIEQHLDEPLDLTHLCAVSGLSKYHFHRQCSAVFKVPVITLVKLLKLKRAAQQLAFRPLLKVIDIALVCGYDTHEGFSRAFKQYFALSPRDFRRAPDWTYWQTHYEPIALLRESIMSDIDYLVELVDFDQVTLATFEHRGAPNTLWQTLRDFIDWRKSESLAPARARTFNLVYDDPRTTAADDYRFDLGCEVSHSENFTDRRVVKKTIPEGRCARIRYVGSDDGISAAVDYLYSHWLPKTEHSLRDFPLFFERVRFFPEVAEAHAVTDIFLPIE